MTIYVVQVFNDIRKRHPHYRVAILYVLASEETTLRCATSVSDLKLPVYEALSY